jgi:protein-tyrosine-phosphatase
MTGVLAGLVLLSAPRAGIAQRLPAPTEKTVLFVCEHGTAKSLLAKVLFEQYSKQVGLHMRAESRGTHADSIVPLWMLRGLALDHVQLGSWRPQTLRAGDLATASYVVSFDVPRTATAATHAPRTQWDGLPSVTQDYAKGRDAIKAHVHQLVDSLKRSEKRNGPS